MEGVVVAHGLWMPSTGTALLARRLAAAGFRVHRFHYRSVTRDIDHNAECLADFCRGLPDRVLHFVGHSLGGLVVLAMLEHERPTRPGRVVCLGSPVRGSRAVEALARGPGRWLLGRSVGGLLTPRPAWRQARDVGVIAGESPFGVGRLLARFPDANDGTVGVDETRLEGAADHLILSVTHASLLWSKTVAMQVAHFLREGKFAR
jgi:pimeloyl-ACP methyl ester carboxylesterase